MLAQSFHLESPHSLKHTGRDLGAARCSRRLGNWEAIDRLLAGAGPAASRTSSASTSTTARAARWRSRSTARSSATARSRRRSRRARASASGPGTRPRSQEEHADPHAALRLAAHREADLHRRRPGLREGGARRGPGPRHQRRQLDQDLGPPWIPEFADLVPLFVEEARDRIERLATFVPQMDGGPRRRWSRSSASCTRSRAPGGCCRSAPLAELCHAAEEVLHAAPPGHDRAADPGRRRAERHGRHRLARRASRSATPSCSTCSCAPRRRRLRRRAGARLRRRRLRTAPVAKDAKDSKDRQGRRTARPRPTRRPRGRGPGAAEAAAPAAHARRSAATSGSTPPSLDAVAERATQVRIMALAGRQVVERIYELARLAEEGLHEPQPTQVLAVLSTMLRRVAVELEGGQRRLIRASEEQLDKMLALQLQPLRGSLHLARPPRPRAGALPRPRGRGGAGRGGHPPRPPHRPRAGRGADPPGAQRGRPRHRAAGRARGAGQAARRPPADPRPSAEGPRVRLVDPRRRRRHRLRPRSSSGR